jgi:hypothetical protein
MKKIIINIISILFLAWMYVVGSFTTILLILGVYNHWNEIHITGWKAVLVFLLAFVLSIITEYLSSYYYKKIK